MVARLFFHLFLCPFPVFFGVEGQASRRRWVDRSAGIPVATCGSGTLRVCVCAPLSVWRGGLGARLDDVGGANRLNSVHDLYPFFS